MGQVRLLFTILCDCFVWFVMDMYSFKCLISCIFQVSFIYSAFVIFKCSYTTLLLYIWEHFNMSVISWKVRNVCPMAALSYGSIVLWQEIYLVWEVVTVVITTWRTDFQYALVNLTNILVCHANIFLIRPEILYVFPVHCCLLSSNNMDEIQDILKVKYVVVYCEEYISQSQQHKSS